ncbi:DUF2513 domain-containing protein [Staphylococcus aureus]|nr:DUF2513 domain-containing protein [Staphylococcus aureus]
MKLKHDCIREVLLVIESDLKLNNVLDNEDLENTIKNFSREDIEYTVKQLTGAGYIDAEFYMEGYFVKHMNFSGHNLWMMLEMSKFGEKLKLKRQKFLRFQSL